MAQDIRAVFAPDGLTAAFYDAAIDPPERIPADAVAISTTDWLAFLAGGKRWDGAALEDYTPPAPAPIIPDISDRQFARGLWGDGIITYADFLGFIGPGTIPKPIQDIVDELPDDDTGKPTARKDAVGFLTGSKLYQFSHPLVEFFRQALAAQDPKWTPDYLRQQWLLWATL